MKTRRTPLRSKIFKTGIPKTRSPETSVQKTSGKKSRTDTLELLARSPQSPVDVARANLKRATLRLFDKARREAEAAGLDLTEWEAEFLNDVKTRVETYGRAFFDPDKGAMGGTLSLRQGLKLKEIRRKARKVKAPDIGREEI